MILKIVNLDPNTIDSLEVLLNKRFPDIVIK